MTCLQTLDGRQIKEENDGEFKMGPYAEWVDLPNIRVKPFVDGNKTVKLCGPKNDKENKLESYSNIVCGKCISTYPKGVNSFL